MSLLGNVAASVREINRRYAKPEIQTTRFVKICLWSLRIYLLSMVFLMVYALVRQSMASSAPAETASPSVAATNAAPTVTQPGQVPR
jgi:hypothetical protein